MARMATIRAQIAENKAEATFDKKSKAIDDRVARAASGKALAEAAQDASYNGGVPATPAADTSGEGGGGDDGKKLFGGRKIGRREAWVRLSILTESEHVKGVLEYWEDKEETRAALENAQVCISSDLRPPRPSMAFDDPLPSFASAQDNCFETIDKSTRLRNQLDVEHLAARDTADSARQVFDKLLDGTEMKITEATGVMRRWHDRCERVETLVNNSFSQLRRAVSMLTSRAVLNDRIPQPARGNLTRMGKQCDEVDGFLAKMAAPVDEATLPAGAPESTPPASDDEDDEGGGNEDGGKEGQRRGLRASKEDGAKDGGGKEGGKDGRRGSLTTVPVVAASKELGGQNGAMAASDISMAVASLLNINSADGGNSGTVSETDLRAAQALQLCQTSEAAILQLYEELRIDVANKRAYKGPESAPQLEGVMAQEFNMRMPRRLPRAQLMARAISPDGAMHRGPPSGMRPPQSSDSTDTADAGGANAAGASERWQPDIEESEVMESVGRVAVIDPITLAGTAELEAEAEAEAALGVNAMEREIAEMELNAEQTRDELKARELKVLTEKLGKEEARKRAALTVSPPRRPKPPQNAKRPQTAGRRPSAQNRPGGKDGATAELAAVGVASVPVAAGIALPPSEDVPVAQRMTFMTEVGGSGERQKSTRIANLAGGGPSAGKGRSGAQSAGYRRGSSTTSAGRPGTAPRRTSLNIMPS